MFYFMYITIPLICGAVLDMIFGEPKHMKHPVVMIGSLISFLEKKFNTAPETCNMDHGQELAIVK